MVWLVGLLMGCAAGAEDGRGMPLRAGDRVIVFGDSITQNGLYIAYLDAILRAGDPGHGIEFLNHGISSETISGTSEADHDPRRPNAHDRFERDVAAWRPDVVVACFGMNDGNYHPPDEERFARFRAGVVRLIERTEALGARLVLLTPPPFDPYRRQVGDPMAREYGYKFPAIDYDQALGRFAAWERSLARPHRLVIDLHTQMNQHLEARRSGEVRFALAPDGVHPDETGHLLMALGLLDALDVVAGGAELAVDVESGEVRVGTAELFRLGPDVWTISWTRGLPIPRDPKWDARSLAIEGMPARLGAERVTVEGLPPGRYDLTLAAEGATWACEWPLDAAELARGLELSRWWGVLPLQARADALLVAVKEARARRYEAWRSAIERDEPGPPHGVLSQDARRLDELARPGVLELRLERRGG